jgi:hypothetical protein
MHCVVPLAGPQLTHRQHGLIVNYPVEGTPLLRRTLETRPWWIAGRLTARDLTFALREGPELAAMRAAVESWFAGCRIVILPGLTKGALLSALAGAAAIPALDAPLIIDLADILYSATVDIEQSFAADPSVGAMAPYFEANDACYSYFTFGLDDSIDFAAEKKVISRHASAGTYIFRSAAHFIAAAGRSMIEAPDELTVGNALFVCPALNGILRQGMRVMPFQARNVRPVSKLLHADDLANDRQKPFAKLVTL